MLSVLRKVNYINILFLWIYIHYAKVGFNLLWVAFLFICPNNYGINRKIFFSGDTIVIIVITGEIEGG